MPIERKIVLLEKECISDITCDYCGVSIMNSDMTDEDDDKSVKDLVDGVNFKVVFGYNSRHDTEYYDVNLCNDCVEVVLGFLWKRDKANV